MGVFDFKVNSKGDIVFFEFNPQGQFIYLVLLTGFSIGERFADFLLEGSSP